MKNVLPFRNQTPQASAQVVDGKLVLSLPHAVKPVIWQMDFDGVKASALEVHEDPEADTFALRLKTPKGEMTEISSFKTREESMQALVVISHALENAHGKIRKAKDNEYSGVNYKRRPSGAGKWLSVMGITGLIIVLLFVISALSIRPQQVGIAGLSGSASAPAQPQRPVVGVPMNAEDFLQGN